MGEGVPADGRPRDVIPDLTGFTLNASAGIRRWGGTCGHPNGPLFDASPQISVSFPVCGMIDVLRVDERTWQGTCTTDSDHDHSTVTAHFAPRVRSQHPTRNTASSRSPSSAGE